ncbi:MAG: hypothetical protein ACLFO1_10185 [Spirochaetaceae bacterium]
MEQVETHGSGRSTLRLGEFLVKTGAMTPEQVQEVLEAQRRTPSRLFGQIAISKGYIGPRAIDQYFGLVRCEAATP